MPDRESHRRRMRTTVLISGLLAAGALAAGFAAIALASGGATAKQRQPAITGSIRLRHIEVRAGRTVRGEVVFRNRTSRTKVLLRGCKVDGLFAIAVRASDGYLQEPVFSLVGCRPEQAMVARPGTTIYRFQMSASYQECSQSARHDRPRSSKYWEPLCRKDYAGNRDVMPPLPAGRYTALFVPAGKWNGPHVRPVTLVVTR